MVTSNKRRATPSGAISGTTRRAGTIFPPAALPLADVTVLRGAHDASPAGKIGVMRVCEGGKITHHINVATQAYACMLGGPQRQTLFMLTAETINPDGARAKSSGRIEMVEVEVPGSGLP